MNLPSNHIKKIIELKLVTDGYKLNRSNEKYIVATKYGKYVLGSRVAILFNQQSIYLNVQNEYGFRGYFPFSFGKNKRIIKNLINGIV